MCFLFAAERFGVFPTVNAFSLKEEDEMNASFDGGGGKVENRTE